jgi:two-component system invasion response regulator UvrY
VVRLIASGQTVGDIADRLPRSVKTVCTYRARISRKCASRITAELMQYALRNHLLD